MASIEHRPGTAVMELSSGAQFDLNDPNPRLITVQVVGHHLSNVCRYAGAVKRHLSVAEHTLLVAAWLEEIGEPASIVLGGLHHDDAEFVAGDMTRPMKEKIPGFKPVENEIMHAVELGLAFHNLGIDHKAPIIKQADQWAMAAEAYYLMPTQGRDWWSWGLYKPGSVLDGMPEVGRLRMRGMSNINIRDLWIGRHFDLVRQVGSERDKATTCG